MQYMSQVLHDPGIPEDCGVAIEYQLPQASKRVDFILSGMGEDQSERLILIELKQWETASLTDKDAIVRSFVGGAVRELTHPSYQVWSYASLLEHFNQTIEEDHIQLQPCAYLHNYRPDGVIRHPHYAAYTALAPVFLRGDAVKLQDFIKRFVKYGDRSGIIYRMDHGKIRPSRMLADSMASMLRGNAEFVMIDDQKIAYEAACALAAKPAADEKRVLIVRGGPGTGKSVVAVNLLVELTKRGLVTSYVSKNAAPRAVYESRLTGTLKKTVISNLFKGSGSFVATPPNTFDVLIVDEAHRLNEKSGLYRNLGENQIGEILNASRSTVFFIDEDQRVTLSDVGTIEEIRKWAGRAGAVTEELELASQFRCNGSDGYLSWLDNTLQIRETAQESLREADYDFRIFSSPVALREAIEEKNRRDNKARMVAGYCWNWRSKKNPALYDVEIPGYDFRMQWNLKADGSRWIIGPDSVNEIGCIHTCQGLEVDYIGVIIGPDLVIENGTVCTNPAARARSDRSISGYRGLLERDPVAGQKRLDLIIKNTYRTLMTRGMKGCYVFCVDHKTQQYLADRIA